MPFFLGALCSESWLLLLLLGLLAGPSCEPVELWGQKTTFNGGASRKHTPHKARASRAALRSRGAGSAARAAAPEGPRLRRELSSREGGDRLQTTQCRAHPEPLQVAARQAQRPPGKGGSSRHPECDLPHRAAALERGPRVPSVERRLARDRGSAGGGLNKASVTEP